MDDIELRLTGGLTGGDDPTGIRELEAFLTSDPELRSRRSSRAARLPIANSRTAIAVNGRP